jgi:hypothetical protein
MFALQEMLLELLTALSCGTCYELLDAEPLTVFDARPDFIYATALKRWLNGPAQ